MKSTPLPYSRVNRPLSAAESYYSRLSPFYDFLAYSEKKFIKQGLELLDPQQGEKILEIGSGTGYAQLHIARILGDGLSIGLDLSAGMCQIAQRKLTQAGLSRQSILIRNNTLPIPFQTGCFDGVFLSFTLELFDTPQISEVLNECRRILKPGGRMVLVSLSKDQPLPWAGKLYEMLHDRFPKLLDCRPIPTRSLVENADFEIIRDECKLMWGLPVIILLARKKFPR
jgi:demethylmenaquinone methyltransferase/2-methoxy-6-polyprenyl-1,4-benzoquinol methylase